MTILMKEKIPKIAAIIPAAGIGRRMNISYPKQYSIILNKTLIEYAIESLLSQPYIKSIVVAIRSNDHFFDKLFINTDKKIKVVIGGETRVHSVMAALNSKNLNHIDWVMIHDSVRPCLCQDDINRLLSIIRYSKIGGILAKPVYDTIKKSNSNKKNVLFTIDNKNLWHALTPQLFHLDLLKKCISKSLKDKIKITDESSALEYCGYNPILIHGRSDNIKVTYKEDLLLARFFLQELKNIRN